jgi:hypothetical protein
MIAEKAGDNCIRTDNTRMLVAITTQCKLKE